MLSGCVISPCDVYFLFSAILGDSTSESTVDGRLWLDG
jgi:hypothetical protein